MKVALSIILLFLGTENILACSFNGDQTLAGNLTPTTAFQIQNSISSGNYFSVNVTCGSTYTFSTCDNGGSASWDSQITILATDGITEHAYNDDNCGGLQSSITWTSNFTGSIYVLISQYSCDNSGGSTGANLAYSYTPASLDPSFTISSTNCNSASSTITGDNGGTFSFNIGPGDGAIINPTTGEITNATQGANYDVDYTLNCGVFSTQSVSINNTGDASFYFTETCGGGITTITGDMGGGFSFNPDLGDGAQINASSGAVTNGMVGTTYTVEYSVCGTSSSQTITALDNNCFTLNGDAQYMDVNGEPCIELTQAINSQNSCAWNSSQIDFSNDFSLSLDYYFGNNINGADGNTFTFQPSGSTSCGTNGQQLGAGAITNALVIEFDTYNNGSTGELSCDHIAIEIDGDMTNGMPLAGPVCAKSGGGNIDDGGTYSVDIAWNSATQQLDIYFDGAAMLSTTYDFVTNVFGGQSNVYWGATSATGGLNNQQYFCPSSIVILPIELISFSSECSNNSEVFYWTTASESRVDYFQLEYTFDGLVFYPSDQVFSQGDSQEEQSYSLSIPNESEKQRYYRLRIVDENGEINYSGLISSKQCSTDSMIASIQNTSSQTIINTNESVDYTLINNVGQQIKNGFADSQIALEKIEFANGIYYLQVTNKSGVNEIHKLYF